MSNPRVAQKRAGSDNKSENPKSMIQIPENPIARQPNGTKPPSSFIGKENQVPFDSDSSILPRQPLQHSVDNQIAGIITQHCNREPKKSPAKEQSGKFS